MEFLEGRELRDIIRSQRLDLATAVDLAAQVAEGLAFAHARGIVHRDVKPANVMVVEANRAKLMDFGIARVRVSDLKTQTGQLLGSPKYMSPEQVLGRPVDHRSDIFSLGVVLHEMLAGAAPFNGTEVMALMYQVCNAQPAPPSALNPAVTRTLDLIVARCLEKEPEKRYQDAAAMAADLRACLPGLAAGGAPAPAIAAAEPGAAIATERTLPLGTATIVGPVAGLHVSARFDSHAALARLLEPRGDDRRRMSPSTEPPSILRRWLLDGALMAALALVTGAGAAAWFIAA
jgi:serine/threonine-protein kinase